MVRPNRPSSRMRSTICWGYSSARSSRWAFGMISRSVNSRTVARISRWTSVSPSVCARRFMWPSPSRSCRRVGRPPRRGRGPAGRPVPPPLFVRPYCGPWAPMSTRSLLTGMRGCFNLAVHFGRQTPTAEEPALGTIDGPYFEDLYRGQRFEGGPGLTLTEGLAAAHQAIVGGRSHLFLDHGLSRRVAGGDAALAAPNLVWDVVIGQSTLVTHTVVANLFYRGVVFRRAPRLGDTLRTVTEVVGLRQNSRRAGRAATGLAALRISTVDQEGRRVLDFWRCAMLPLRDQDAD